MSDNIKNDSATSEELSTSELDSVVGGGNNGTNGGSSSLQDSTAKVSKNSISGSSGGVSSTGSPDGSFSFGT
jgi:hypothetical protein